MIQYILECIAFQLVFLIIYDFFLKRETFFQWNRVYLIGTYALSIILPWIKIEAFRTEVPAPFIGYSEFLWSLDQSPIVLESQAAKEFNISWQETLFITGAMFALIWFGLKIWRLYQLRQKGNVHYFKNFTRILVPESNIAFSFFKSIFLGEKVPEKEYNSIISHELVHIKQRHTLDLLFFELMRIVNWFNPLVYVYQRRISELHEFIADAHVPKAEINAHYELLLSQAFQTQNISFVNQFFKSSLIKKRIVMLQKSKSKGIWQLKYLVLAPVIMGMLFYTSCNTENKSLDQAEISSSDHALIAKLEQKLANSYTSDGDEYNSSLMKKFESSEEILSKEEYFEYILQIRRLIDVENYRQVREDENFEPFIVEMELPSSEKYNTYVLQKKALKSLDSKLKASIDNYKKQIRVLAKPEEYPSGSKEFKVGDSKNLTAEELTKLKMIMKNLEHQDNEFGNMVLTDGFNAFHIYTPKFKVAYDETEIELISEDEVTELSFAVIDQVPVFPGCENVSNQRECFNEMIQKHISKNFNYPEEALKNGIQGRVNTMFMIQADGTIDNIRMRGPDKLLENEVERIIKRLPRMAPGKHKGKSVDVPFSIPVTFKLD